ncbi:spindle assembly checkpoint kinase [Tritrichomonas musculus]|uniref:Spindle assembly checkpoint kinase n=1 Tax=Tritrichomonas musculus TaxID=1915356 RepID=A0ABR2JPZ3_9EUKA
MPECYKKLIRCCWVNNPDERPSFDEIVDIIKNTPEFITDYIDESEFYRYVEYIESKGVKHDSINLIENDIMYENKEEEMPLKLNVKLLELRNFEKKEKIGFGTFGKVYKIQEKLTGQLFAAKITKKIINDKMKDTTAGKSFIQEVEILSSLDHPGVVKFIGYSPINFKKKLKPSIVKLKIPGS